MSNALKLKLLQKEHKEPCKQYNISESNEIAKRNKKCASEKIIQPTSEIIKRNKDGGKAILHKSKKRRIKITSNTYKKIKTQQRNQPVRNTSEDNFSFDDNSQDYHNYVIKNCFETSLIPINVTHIDESLWKNKPKSIENDPCKCIEGSCQDTTCLSFSMYDECSLNCPRKGNCKNHPIHDRIWKDCSVFNTGTEIGLGIRTKEDIAKDEFIIEYVGEVLPKDTEITNKEYCMEVSEEKIVVDARKKRGLAGYINHSSDPNCVATKWKVFGLYRVGIFALREIKKEEELTIDYDWDNYFWDKKKTKQIKNKRKTTSIKKREEPKKQAKKIETWCCKESEQNKMIHAISNRLKQSPNFKETLTCMTKKRSYRKVKKGIMLLRSSFDNYIVNDDTDIVKIKPRKQERPRKSAILENEKKIEVIEGDSNDEEKLARTPSLIVRVGDEVFTKYTIKRLENAQNIQCSSENLLNNLSPNELDLEIPNQSDVYKP